MDVHDAAELIAPALPAAGGTWADLGAGSGTFTRALATLLGASGQVYAVDRDPRCIDALRALAVGAHDAARARIVAQRGDLAQPLALPPLDGVLLANALHYVDARAQAATLARIAAGVRAGGRIVLVEYEGRRPSRWVPFPVSLARLADLAREAALAPPVRVGMRESAFGGTMYAAYLDVRAATAAGVTR